MSKSEKKIKESVDINRVNRVMSCMLLIVRTLQHILPILYCEKIRPTISVIVNVAYKLASHFSKLSDNAPSLFIKSTVRKPADLLLFWHQLLLSSCEMIWTSSLCNGLIASADAFEVSVFYFGHIHVYVKFNIFFFIFRHVENHCCSFSIIYLLQLWTRITVAQVIRSWLP